MRIKDHISQGLKFNDLLGYEDIKYFSLGMFELVKLGVSIDFAMNIMSPE